VRACIATMARWRLARSMGNQWDFGYLLEFHEGELVFWVYTDDGDDWVRACVVETEPGKRWVITDVHAFNWHSFEEEKTTSLLDIEPTVLSTFVGVAGRMLGGAVDVPDGPVPDGPRVDRVRWDPSKVDSYTSTRDVVRWWFDDTGAE